MCGRRLLPAIGIVTVALAAGIGPAPARPPEAAVDDLVRDTLRLWDVPGAAVVVVDADGVRYLKGFGARERGREPTVTPDTVFPLASCTKAFTATALAARVGDGAMNWDDPVRQHLPDFHLSDPAADRAVTLRDLLTHRTGLAGHDLLWYRAAWPLDETIRRAGRLPLAKPFRSAFQYQSVMYTAAGRAAGGGTAAGWAKLVRERLLDPLGMTGTSLTTDEARKAADRAAGHRRTRDGLVVVLPWYEQKEPNPAGSVHLTARDLGAWLRFHLGDGRWNGKRLVAAEALAETHKPQMPIPMDELARAVNPDTTELRYAMGWVVQDYRGHTTLSHGGAIDGFRAHLTLLPDAKLAVGILSNLHGSRANHALANKLTDLLLNLPPRDWDAYYQAVARREQEVKDEQAKKRQSRRKPETKPSAEWGAFAGEYEDPAYGTATVRCEGGKLVWEWSTFRRPLEHWYDDTFAVTEEYIGDPLVTFTVENGRVTAMEVFDRTFKRK